MMSRIAKDCYALNDLVKELRAAWQSRPHTGIHSGRAEMSGGESKHFGNGEFGYTITIERVGDLDLIGNDAGTEYRLRFKPSESFKRSLAAAGFPIKERAKAVRQPVQTV